ncbi:MAG TPA: bifunctional UDP-sugar hydrolase/5'-nucleotidase [Bryobacteraceae bacterium]|nr:bifunctional UDP-sugar hydrolase/5'-nucleotidase [Bryobacteraceae bacterium]
MSWRRVLKRVLWLGPVFALSLAAADLATLTILHTNDLHARLTPLENGKGGFARLAGLIRQQRDGCADCILLNAGDLVQGSPVSTIFRGTPVYEITKLFGYDAQTLGNHDFDYGWQQTLKFVEIANYPTVLANMVDAGGAPLVKASYIILPVNGLRVAVIGLLTDTMKELSTPALMGPWRTTSVYEAARRTAAQARKEADVVVLLGHLDAVEEAVILHTIPDIAIVIGGHVHHGMQAPLSEGDRVMVRLQAYGEELGRLEAVVDKRTKRLASWSWKRLPVDEQAPVAEDVAREVQQWEAKVAKVVDQPIGKALREIPQAEVRKMIERAMREATGADFAFMNAGGVRDRFPQGQLLARHVWNIMPFDNLVVTGRFKGSVLPAVVTAGRTIDPDKEYTLAVSDFTAANMEAPSQLGVTGLVFGKDGPLLRDVILDWVRTRKVLE